MVFVSAACISSFGMPEIQVERFIHPLRSTVMKSFIRSSEPNPSISVACSRDTIYAKTLN